MLLQKFGYSSDQLKLREYRELKNMIKRQVTLSQITHTKLKEDFENELENLEKSSFSKCYYFRQEKIILNLRLDE